MLKGFSYTKYNHNDSNILILICAQGKQTSNNTPVLKNLNLLI